MKPDSMFSGTTRHLHFSWLHLGTAQCRIKVTRGPKLKIHLSHRCRSRQIFGGVKQFCPKKTKKWPPKKRLHMILDAIFIKSHQAPFLIYFQGPPKERFHMILGAIFSNQSTSSAIFARIFRDFAKVFIHLAQNSTDFARIFIKWKLFGVRLKSRFLHHWLEQTNNF